MSEHKSAIMPTASREEIEEGLEGGSKDFKGLDDASKFLAGREEITYTEEEEKAVLRKIDRWLLPLMMFAGMIVYMDSQAYGSAAIFGMIQDLDLFTVVSTDPLVTETSRYSWTSSITAIGSVLSTYPLLLLSQKLPLGKYAGGVIFYSGFFAIMMIAANNFAGTMVVRFLYGFQVVGTPINIIITAMWWTTEEQALRVAIWFAGAPIGGIIGQAFSYGAAQIGGPFKNSPWKWIYVLIGSLSMAYALVFLLLFPDSPMKARFLTERQRHIAVLRLRSNNTGIQGRKFKWAHVIDTLQDPQTWLLTVIKIVIAFANTCFGSFAGLLLANSGIPTLEAITLLMPSQAVIIASMLSAGYIVRRFNQYRTLVGCVYLLPSIAGYCVLWQLSRDSRAALLGGLYSSVMFYGAYIQSVSLVSSNVAGHTKKVTMNAIIGTCAYLGAIAGPFAFKGEEAAQGYPTGILTVLAMLCVVFICFILLMLHYTRQNKLKQAYLDAHPETASAEEMAFMDLTDRENPHFRYTL